MLNFNKKKYVSFDNLKSFNGLLQSSLKEKIDGYKSEINVKVDERFKVLSGQQQKDSEVIDAREGQVSLSENLKTYVKKEEFVTECEHLNEKFTNEIEEIKTDILTMSNEVEVNTEYINTNKSAIQRVIDFVGNFTCEFKFVSSTNGYIKFPNILGGALIQWGYITIPVGNETTVCTLNKPFSDFNYCFHLTPYMTNGVYSTVHTNGVTENSINVVLKGVNGSNPGGGLYWFAIGR